MIAHPLDGALYYLGREVPGVFDVVMAGKPKALLLFRSEAWAQEHLKTLPEEVRVHAVAASDFRAKEELLRAAAAQGAVRVLVDADARLEPKVVLSLAHALTYVQSFKNETTCL